MSMMTLKENKGKIELEEDLSGTFHLSRGLQQRDGLTAVLFNFLLEKVVRRICTNSSGTIQTILP